MDSRPVNSRARVISAFAAVYLIWGSTYLAIRFTIETLPPLLTAGLRFLCAGSFLYIFMRLKNEEPAPDKRHWKSASIIGALLLLGGNGCVVWAERFIPSGPTALFIAITPLWMVLLQWFWFREKRPSTGILAGIGVGFLGVWLLISPSFSNSDSTLNLYLPAVLVLLFASFSWAIGSVYSRRAFLPKSPFLSTGMEMIAGGILLLMWGLLRGEATTLNPASFSFKSMAAFVYLILAGALVGFTAYIWLLKNVGVARASTYAFVNPVVAVILGWGFGGEKLDFHTVFAAMFIVLAVIIITINQRE